MTRTCRQVLIRRARALALLALSGPLLGAAPSTPPPEALSFWEQYVFLQLVAWDGQLFAYGYVESGAQEGEGGVRGGGRALATPGVVGAYFDPNQPPGQNIPTPDPFGSEAAFHLSTWSDWLDDPGTGQTVPFDPGSGVTDLAQSYSYDCANPCTWLDGPLSVDARSTFRVVEGDVVLHNHLQSPAIGFTSAAEDQSHYLIALSGSSIEDWIYVDGPGETATVQVVARVQGTVDAPTEPSSFEAGLYGDLTTSNPGSNYGIPVEEAVARARVAQGASLYSEIQIGGAGTFPAVLDFQRTLSLVWTEDTPSWDLDVRGAFDGDETVSVSREVPTGEWIRVYASLDGHSWCAGPLACDFETQVELVVTSLTATGGVVRSANGIAGTQAVPEPASTALGAAVLVSLAALRRARAPRYGSGPGGR